MTISGSVFSENSSRRGGGAIRNSGDLEVQTSTFVGNYSTHHGAGVIWHEGTSLSILNSTFSGNTSPAGDHFAITNETSSLTISYSTITGNTGGSGAVGGLGGFDSLQFTVSNSIIADNPSGDCGLVGSINALEANLDSDGSCVGFTHTGAPYLDPLADNGGGTMTHALQIDSPAISAASGVCPITDQRGSVRPQGSACDLGAYEYDGPEPTPSPTPEIEPCYYEAISNTNCRLSDCAAADFVGSLPMGDSALLIGLNPSGTHGLFELPTGEECWMMMSLLTGIDPGACGPPTVVPPPCPTTPPDDQIECRIDLDESECEQAGGTYHPGVAAAPWCECP
jgi:predicted outer membrane repeat protein